MANSEARPQRIQPMLFGDRLPDIDTMTGYRGPAVCRAIGITYRQLDYWDRTGLVVPSVRSATGSGSQRLYSFRDVLVLKLVKRLLDTGVSLQQMRLAIEQILPAAPAKKEKERYPWLMTISAQADAPR